MTILEQEKNESWGKGYRRCLVKATDRAHQLLREKARAPDDDGIHSVKSILCVAIEQAERESDCLISAQELLRELLTLVALQTEPVRQERQEALEILEKLKWVGADLGSRI